MLQRVEGIVIRTNDYGETNKIVTLYTKENGKVAVMARGAKRPKSRFASSAQLFVYGIFVYQSSKGMGSLNQADIIDSFKVIRSDLMLTAYAAFVVELLDKLTEDKKPSGSLFDLLQQTLTYMNEGLDPEILTRIFEMKMLYVAGVAPILDRCSLCGNPESDFVFSLKHAGLLCHQCKLEDPYHRTASKRILQLLRLFQQMNINRLGNINVKTETKEQLKEIISAYYDEFVGVHLKSKRFLDQIDQMYKS